VAVRLGELMVGSPEIETVIKNAFLEGGTGDGDSVVDAPITLVEGRD